jgi:biotin carboxyl carrier protein
MPGRIVRVLVSEGDTVTKGTPLVVVEAMKMENEIKSPRDGTVTRVAIGAGDLVESRAVLVELS